MRRPHRNPNHHHLRFYQIPHSHHHIIISLHHMTFQEHQFNSEICHRRVQHQQSANRRLSKPVLPITSDFLIKHHTQLHSRIRNLKTTSQSRDLPLIQAIKTSIILNNMLLRFHHHIMENRNKRALFLVSNLVNSSLARKKCEIKMIRLGQ